MIPAARHDEPSIISMAMEARMDPSTLPRAIALQFDTGEIVYPAGGQPVSRGLQLHRHRVAMFRQDHRFP
jgi:hypothetical protein